MNIKAIFCFLIVFLRCALGMFCSYLPVILLGKYRILILSKMFIYLTLEREKERERKRVTFQPLVHVPNLQLSDLERTKVGNRN